MILLFLSTGSGVYDLELEELLLATFLGKFLGDRRPAFIFLFL
jgi:hypothetical protein